MYRLARERANAEDERQMREEEERKRRQQLEAERDRRMKEEYQRKLEEMRRKQQEEERRKRGLYNMISHQTHYIQPMLFYCWFSIVHCG